MRSDKEETKHTPGPWGVNYYREMHKPYKVIVYGGPMRIALCYKDGNGIYKDQNEAEANARLIAAAPDLLESLKWALNNLNSYDSPSDYDLGMYNKAVETIAKATLNENTKV